MVDPEIMNEFLAESREHLATVEDEILELEKGSADEETVNHLFRALHTIKGASSFLGLQRVTALAHALENVMGKVRSGALTPDHAIAEALLKGTDKLEALIENHEDESLDGDAEVAALEAVLEGGTAESEPAAGAEPSRAAAPSRRREPVARAPEPGPGSAPPKRAAAPEAGRHAPAKPGKPRAPAMREPKDSTVRISVSLLDKLMNLASELVLVRNQNMQAVAVGDREQLTAIAQRLNVVTSDLQASVMQTRMRPIGGVFTRFNRIVRDLARHVNKEVELEIIGADVDLDKGIIEAIGDPLTHLIRNAVGHGVETPEEREAAGKNRRGQLRIAAFHRHGQVNIQIEDDGRGMDSAQIIAKAIEKGLISASQANAMTERDAFNLVFLPGFSMASQVTDLAGRGVGMDVVKDTFGKFGGAVDINSTLGKGTRITIKLPLTLAIVPALIVAVDGVCYAVPQINIAEVVWLHGEDVYQRLEIVDDQEVYWLRGKLLPVLRLSKLLGLRVSFEDPESGERQRERRAQQPDQRARSLSVAEDQRDGPAERRASRVNSLYIIVLRLGEERFGLLVDTIVDTEEIVVKALHEQLKECGAFAGTTVLGDGRIAMILDVAALVELGGLRFNQIDTPVSLLRSSGEDRQTVILFDLGGRETFAVPLCLINRVEEVPLDRLQRANDREYLEFRGQIIPLIRIEEAVGNIETRYRDDLVYVVIPKCDRPIGVLAARILDTVEVSREIDSTTICSTGVVGSALLDGDLTLFVDLFQIIEAVRPGWLDEERSAADQSRRVLLLEDSAFYAALISPYLRNAGHEVVHVLNGREGLDRLAAEDFDCVISDIEMPVMNGLEFARSARQDEKNAGLPMVAISAMTDPTIGNEALKAGFDEFHSKLDQSGLLNRLIEICGEELQRERGVRGE